MEIVLRVPDALLGHPETYWAFRMFAQRMFERLAVGEVRYGRPHKRKTYMKRMGLELRTYRRGKRLHNQFLRPGNFEQLVNLANYCVLESIAPQHPNFHFDPNAVSATRSELGGQIA